jgi:hypothetical protein
MARLVHDNSRFAAILLITIASAAVLPAQVSTPQDGKEPAAEEIPYVLHINAREVVIDVIAVDGRDRSVTNLVPADLRITEKLGKSAEVQESVSSLRLIDPDGSAPSDLPESGFRIAANESCLQRQSIHYQLVYNPGEQALTQGYHEVHITTARRGVRLFYRHSYYIGATAPVESAVLQTKAQIDHDLELDACSHPLVPLSISLRAARISTGSSNTARYKVTIENDSLAFVSFSNNGRGLQLDYGACNFNAAGKPIGYVTASSNQVLTPVEYARAEAHGLQRILEFAPPADLAMTRFVVRDRATGNLGLADVTFPLVEGPPQTDPDVTEKLRQQSLQYLKAKAQQQDAEDRARSFGYSASFQPYYVPPMGPLGSFGSVVPRPNAFCGDVYELKSDIPMLPDFRSLDPIGSIYTASLAVPNQIFSGTNGIPGVTDRTVWFGVDYRADFWVREAGTYDFRLTSDDGAILQIDDKRVIDLDGLHSALTKDGHIALDAGLHTIHVPYYEGTPYAVALSLLVRKPGEDIWRIFDLLDFAEPAHQPE